MGLLDHVPWLSVRVCPWTGVPEIVGSAEFTGTGGALIREHARHAASMRTRLARLAADVAALPVADSRAPEEIIGYDDAGLPR